MMRNDSSYVDSENTGADLNGLDEPVGEDRKYLEKMIEGIEATVIIYDTDARIVECNRAVPKILGLTKEQVLGKKTTDIAHFFREDGSPMPIDEYPVNQVIQKKEPLRNFICGYKVHRKDNLRWALLNAVPLFDHKGNLCQVIATHLDTTERKRMEEALEESRQRLQNILDSVETSIFVFDHLGSIIGCNQKALESVGMVRDEMLGKKIQEIAQFLQEDGKLMSDEEHPVTFALRTKQAVKNAVCGFAPFGKKDVVWAYYSVVPILDREGELIQVVTTSLDYTDRKKAEEALKRAEAHYRAIVEDQTELIRRYLPDGRLTFVNHAFCRYFEKDPEELLGEIFIPQMPEEDHEKVDHHLASLGPDNSISSYEHRVITPTGEICWLKWIDRMILNEHGEPSEIQSVGRDITFQKQMEEKLHRYQKELEIRVQERTVELLQSNEKLKQEIEIRKKTEKELKASESMLFKSKHELHKKNISLEETNIALKILLEKRENDKIELEKKIRLNVKELIFPCLEKLKSSKLSDSQIVYADILESNLKDIISQFAYRLSSEYSNITPAEIEVANLVKQGKSTKDIAEFMCRSPRTIDTHRKNLRKKLGLKDSKKKNLRSYLLSIQ